ncbi:MAG: hypothetical protein O3B13_15925 [Planctomycetota bacterium]|nr:hypothetical protein [Planctomycetota bacterium]
MDRLGLISFHQLRYWIVAWSALTIAGLGHGQLAAEPISLGEAATEQRVFSVRCRLQVSGHIETSSQPVVAAEQKSGDKTPAGLKLEVDGKFSFLERRLPAGGQDADAFRTLRQYQLAEADITIDGQKTVNQLPVNARKIVAEGTGTGLRVWSPNTRLSYLAVELLRAPGDSLALAALLPVSPVEENTNWEPPYWTLPMLTGIEAISKSTLKCSVSRIDSQYVVIKLAGGVEGATLGAFANIEIEGQIAWDRKAGHIRQAKITQREKRTVGAVSPGMNVTATVYVDRQISGVKGSLTDEATDAIPISPEAEQMALAFECPWNLTFGCDRDWHVFHQTKDVAVLRYVRNGSLIAQCNVSPVPPVAAGSHTPEPQFQADIQTALGGQFRRFEKAEQIPTDDGRWLYRVTATGQARDVAMHWFYYLCAAPDGHQVAFVYAVESRLVEQFGGQDIAQVRSLQFLPAASTITRPAP